MKNIDITMWGDVCIFIVDDKAMKIGIPKVKDHVLKRADSFLLLAFSSRPIQTKALLEQRVIGIAFETVIDHKRLPLLTPMVRLLEELPFKQEPMPHMANGGSGVLLGGVPGVAPGKVVVIGGGIVGSQAAKMAVGLGADVTILDNNLQRLRELDDLFEGKLTTVLDSNHN